MEKILKKFFIVFILFSLILSISNISNAVNELDPTESNDEIIESIDNIPLLIDSPNPAQEILDSLDISPDIDNFEATTFSYNGGNVFEFKSQDVTIDQDVEGDVFVISAGTVTINSRILGNVFIIAKNVVIGENANLESSLFSMSQSLSISGYISKNVYAMSQDCNLAETSVFGLDLSLLAQNINLNGQISRNANISGDTIVISNTAKINGNLNYSSKNAINIPENTVNGNVTFSKVEAEADTSTEPSVKSFEFTDWLFSCVSFIIIAIVLYFLFKKISPKFFDEGIDFSQHLIKYILFGLLVLFVAPIACIILLIPGVTAILALILFLLYITMLFIASPISINYISYMCSDKFKEKITLNDNLRQILFIVIFAIIYKLLKLVPFVGGLLTFAIVIIGLGILVKRLFSSSK